MLASWRVWREASRRLKAEHPEWEKGVMRMAWRKLPKKGT